jgi:proteasome lid subunit RPN8/RPN11
MNNVHPEPVRSCLMDDEAVLLAYADFDQADEEVLAIYHSHPTSEPIMSDKDLKRAADESLAYVIVSFMETTPMVRAYRVQRFIGNTIPTNVPIQVVEDAPLPTKNAHPGPWALLAGNRVRIGYLRTGKKTLSTTVAIVMGCDGMDVTLEPEHKVGPRALPLDRIRSVHVLHEGAIAVSARPLLRAQAGRARTLLAGHDLAALPGITALLAEAFPVGMTVSMDES